MKMPSAVVSAVLRGSRRVCKEESIPSAEFSRGRPNPRLLALCPCDFDRNTRSKRRGSLACRLNEFIFGLWLSLVERLVRDQEAVGSNPTSPINNSQLDLISRANNSVSERG